MNSSIVIWAGAGARDVGLEAWGVGDGGTIVDVGATVAG